MAQRITHRLRVRYDECDQQGVVFNSHYFAYFDIALTEAFRRAGYPYGQMTAAGTDLMVAEAHARYRTPARFDDEIDLDWWITRLGNTGMSTRIDVKREGEVLVEGEMRHVFVDLAKGGKRPIPDDVRRALEPYAEDAGAESGTEAEARA
jgi:acyl-CoA thioester hydrolase